MSEATTTTVTPTPATTDKMNMFRLDFQEVYERHLCRHGHFGINVLHLLVVLVIYLSLFGIAGSIVNLIAPENEFVILLCLTIPWFFLVVANVPFRVSIVTAITVLLIHGSYVGLSTALPFRVPVWVWVPLIFAMHWFQQYSHKIYRMHRDMTRFKDKYPKSRYLFTLLLVYELPILLNYLAFGRGDWVHGRHEIDEAVASAS